MDAEHKKEPAHKEPAKEEGFTRRYFLELVGASSIGIVALGTTALSASYLSPNVVKEPPTKFKIGPPEDFPVGSMTFVPDQKVYIAHKKEGGMYAIAATCTHLGCITNWKPDEGIIACPCHGSRFDVEGIVIGGPAPKPLPHYAMTLDDKGQLVVDTGTIVSDEVILKV